MNKISINTAQNVNVEYKLIGLGERMVAFLIDGVLLITYITIMEQVAQLSQLISSDSWTQRGITALVILPAFFYSLLCHVFISGQTIGKLLLKIKVVRLDGAPTQWYNLLVRWMLRLVDIWVFSPSIGILSILLSDKKQRIGDAAAGTIVISVKKTQRISNTLLEDLVTDYEPTFTSVTQLNDADVRIIKDAFTIAKNTSDFKTIQLLRQKVCAVLHIQSDLKDIPFISTILKDYNYYTQSM